MTAFNIAFGGDGSSGEGGSLTPEQEAEIEKIEGKADKITDPVENDLVAQVADGNIKKAGVSAAAVMSAKDDAENARDLAEQWADEDEDVEVETGQYSAKHHALKADGSRAASETARAGAEAARDLAASSGNFAGLYASLSGAKNFGITAYHSTSNWLLLESVADVTAEVPGVSTKWFEIYSPNPLRKAVESATGGSCTVLYDNLGLPSYMRIIPAMNAGDLISGLTGAHPAFLYNGTKIGEIFIGMYAASIIGTRAYSLPRVAPAVSIDFDNAKAACTAKGSGWHLMTNWEWAAVALWCVKNGFQPRGNTNHGRHHTNVWETGIRQDAATYLPGNTSGTGNILAGSGPNSWRHNGDPNGIADLVGNVWEWIDLLKITNGQIIMPPDNHVGLAEASWTAMDHYLSNEAGVLTLKNGSATTTDASISATWSSLTKAGGYTESGLLKLALVSPAGAHPGGTLYVNASGDRLPFRGGSRGNGGHAGLAALHLGYVRGGSSTLFGFRPAFISIP